MTSELLLVADIGGTKTNLALYPSTGEFSPVAERMYFNHDFACIETLIQQFYEDTGCTAIAACFGIAGAVRDGSCDMPNLGWHIDSLAVAETLGFDHIALLNDLEATAYGIATLTPEQIITINEGAPVACGNMALIAAGTGLGEAILFRHGTGYHVSASEGGHANYAPRDEEEIGLLRYLMARYGHVSWERVVSGPGLKNIYDFLKNSNSAPEPDWLNIRLKQAEDASDLIANLALDGRAEICIRTLDRFMAAYGAEAGNLALKALSTSGLYIGGGIAPKILSKFFEDAFISAFQDKGRFSKLLEKIPVRVILEPKTALLGAAHYLSNYS